MKYPVLVLGLVLGAFLFIHTLIAVVFGLGLGNSGDVRYILFGFGVALLWLIGTAFVAPFPQVATWSFVIAALLAALIGFTLGSFFFWAVVSGLLAWMSFRAEQEKAKAREE